MGSTKRAPNNSALCSANDRTDLARPRAAPTDHRSANAAFPDQARPRARGRTIRAPARRQGSLRNRRHLAARATAAHRRARAARALARRGYSAFTVRQTCEATIMEKLKAAWSRVRASAGLFAHSAFDDLEAELAKLAS